MWSSYDTAKGQPEKAPTDERIALELPKPMRIVIPQTTEPAPVDRELAAIGEILRLSRNSISANSGGSWTMFQPASRRASNGCRFTAAE
jgi:hypothetical protein